MRLTIFFLLCLTLLPRTATAQRICIDPGHGRKTVGTTGKHTTEYKICWEIGQQLKQALEKQGMEVILTKERVEQDVPNSERAEIANRARVDLMVRLHCDADNDHGIATYYPAKQGTIRGKQGPDEAVIEASRVSATRFHTALIKSLEGALKNRKLRTDSQTAVGRKLGGALEGSIYAKIPVLLVEMCVLRNAKDEAFITSKEGQKRLVRALAAGVKAGVTPSE
ncbi:MAG: N-acetylmuramoyl-L-alanine amidase [Armatimonadetes bacterium]|nr:N-acetylmuramoyl-L-alanine amidase [Armatimonadota bacterium]